MAAKPGTRHWKYARFTRRFTVVGSRSVCPTLSDSIGDRSTDSLLSLNLVAIYVTMAILTTAHNRYCA